MDRPVRTRFAPSPTGFLHIGGARTALFSWAYAKRHQGQFVLRIEDTDLERSTPEAVQAILDGMQWLGLDYDEGPFYQMERMPIYQQYIEQLLKSGDAYYCYCSKEELEAMREAQVQKSENPRYDGRWRPEEGKTLPEVPTDVTPVIRFKNPKAGTVVWEDLVKGRIEIANETLDDLIIARADGTPTYNFCVVIDDWQMQISHVVRGDDHVNNTPRQINLLHALGADVPEYAHLSMILGDDGQKLSKRHGALSVMQYHEDGYLPEAVLNYLARLGWSHGDAELFSVEQFCEWFDLARLTPSAAQFNTEKLTWVNAHYIKEADSNKLATDIAARLNKLGITVTNKPALGEVLGLYQPQAASLNALAEAVAFFYQQPTADPAMVEKHLNETSLEIMQALYEVLNTLEQWDAETLQKVVGGFMKDNGLKIPKVFMPLRTMLIGKPQSPDLYQVMQFLGKDTVMTRMNLALK